MVTLWSDSWKHLRENSAYAGGYVLSSAVVSAVYRGATEAVGPMTGGDEAPAWLGLFRFGSLLWLAMGGAVCAAVFFSLMGRQIDRPLWRCAGWQDGVRRFFLPWLILYLMLVAVIDAIIRLGEAGVDGALSSLLVIHLALSVLMLPVGVCVMYFGRLDWGRMGQTLEPIYGQFLLTLQVICVCFAQWVLVFMRDLLVPGDTGLDILWLGLYDAVLDYATCFAFVMMWRVCMIHRDRSMEGGGNPFDF